MWHLSQFAMSTGTRFETALDEEIGKANGPTVCTGVTQYRTACPVGDRFVTARPSMNTEPDTLPPMPAMPAGIASTESCVYVPSALATGGAPLFALAEAAEKFQVALAVT